MAKKKISTAELDKELGKIVFTFFTVKCTKEDFERFDGACKLFWGDSRHVMLSSLLNFFESFGERLDCMEEKLDVVTLLTKRVLNLEEKVGRSDDKKVLRMNDGSEVER